MTPSDFKRIEDAAVDSAVAAQEEAGLQILTDGEMRRLSFQSQMPEAVEGFGEFDIDAFLWETGGATNGWETPPKSDLLPSASSANSVVSATCPQRNSPTSAAHNAAAESHVTESQPVRQFLVAGQIRRGISYA